ncbi:MAG: FHA domain-containing protein [Candidatus Promineifilaceae bacterium]
MTPSAYQLVVREGPQAGQTFPLAADSVTIGRDPMADVIIDDVEVSRLHARLSRTEDGWEVADLGSTNGTFVDGGRLGEEAAALAPGQSIVLGSGVVLAFEPAGEGLLEGEEPADEPVMPAEAEGVQTATPFPSFTVLEEARPPERSAVPPPAPPAYTYERAPGEAEMIPPRANKRNRNIALGAAGVLILLCCLALIALIAVIALLGPLSRTGGF